MSFLLLGLLLYTQTLFAAADCKFKYKTGVNEDSAFFKRDASGVASGLAWDILEEISKRTGCEFQGTPMNYVRALEEFRFSKIDVFALVTPQQDWNPFAEHFSVYVSDRVMVVRKDMTPKKLDLESVLNSKHIKFADIIGTSLFFTPEEKFKLEKEDRIVRFPNGDAAVKGLAAGKVQALFISPVYLNFLRKNPLYEKIDFAFDSKHTIDVGVELSKMRMSESQRKTITKAISEMREDGTIKKILGQYLPPEDLVRYR